MPITKCLSKLGYDNIHLVESQVIPSGDFPTIKSPNPEEHEVFSEGINLAKEIGADIILGTDPDCDRIGVVVKNENDIYQVLTGNQTGALLVDYILKATKDISIKHKIIKTIVTSDFGTEIAKSYGASVIETLTGFKFIGEKIKEFENDKSCDFLFGYEESYGYLAGTFVRDKDAVIACTLIVEMAAYYKSLGKSLYDALQDLFKKYGFYVDALDTFIFKGADGQQRMHDIMCSLRKEGELLSILKDIKIIEDYMTKTTQYANGTVKKNIHLPTSDVIKIVFTDDSWIAIRPSGTEPKLKVYYSAVSDSMHHSEEKILGLKQKVEKLKFN